MNLLFYERKRISADMHDELGSGITAIRLMSEMAKRKIKDTIPPELDRISSMASELLNNMHAIIWSLHEEHDRVESLVTFIKKWAAEFFEFSQVNCEVRITGCLSNGFVPGEARRNIFLSVKEALNNVIKHAEATEVIIEISCDPVFKIQIADNGRGFDLEKPRPYGNGLKIMKKRMEKVGGQFAVINDTCTIIILELPYSFYPQTTGKSIPG